MIIDTNNASQRTAGHRAAPVGPNGGGTKFDINLAQAMGEQDDLSVALAAFKEEANKTPRQRCRDQVMEDWHVTQDYIDSLPVDEAKALNDRIEQEVARRMQTPSPLTSAQPDTTGDTAATSAASVPSTAATTISSLQILGARPGVDDLSGGGSAQ